MGLEMTKQCRNRKCPRFEILFEPPSHQKYCQSCGSKLKMAFAEVLQKRGNGRGQPLLTGFVHGGPAESGGDAFVGESDCDVKGCPVAPKGGTVEIPWPLYNKWVFLCRENDVEWIAYLKGEQGEDGTIRLAEGGMYFPKQKANGAHVEAEDNSVEQEGTIAAVHSHVDMSAFFSKEDEAHFNHPVELVVNRKGDVEAVVRVKLECGRYQRTKAKLLLTGVDAVDTQKELEAVLTIEKAVTVASSGYGWRSDRKEGVYGGGPSGYGEILDT